VFPDRAYPANDTSTADLQLKASSNGNLLACAALPADASLMGLALAALALLRRRRG
jgi:hypothetical protein